MQNKIDRQDISIFDIFKIGIGPSSSHTMGPWKAALDFVDTIKRKGLWNQVLGVQIELHGSLAKTGKGHGTDMGVQMGLSGEYPDQIEPVVIPDKLKEIETSQQICLGNCKTIPFHPTKDIVFVFHSKQSRYLSGALQHPNTIFFAAQLENGNLFVQGYHSVGGGFIEKRNENQRTDEDDSCQSKNFVYPSHHASDLISHAEKHQLSFEELIYANELSWKKADEIDTFVNNIAYVMIGSIYRGCHSEGILPGGLNVSRRASRIYRSIIDGLPEAIKSKKPKYHPNASQKELDEWIAYIRSIREVDFKKISNWVICFALAVNEENAAYGKIVTAPTNGAAGVIPAVFMYTLCFGEKEMTFKDIRKFLFCASEVGSLFKKGATISAAAGGCQAEIGVSSSMAAAGLTAIQGGLFRQILMASEIAMEHHLGLTCDPIKGLVQVPCIERNSMGAMKAITASQLAMMSDPDKSVVHIDEVIATMWSTAKDMDSKYKETAEGGLALNVSVKYPEC